MSDSSPDLPQSLELVSLNEDQSSAGRTGALLLVTSDGERIEVDSAWLTAHSSVWKDTLEIGSGSQRVCEVSETAKEIRLLVQALESGQVESSLKSANTLVKLGDKYDIPAASASAKVVLWELLEDTTSQFYPVEQVVSVYASATRLNYTSLMEAAAKKALRFPVRTIMTCSAADDISSAEGKIRLERYLLAYTQAARDSMTHPEFGKDCRCIHRSSNARDESDADKNIWAESVGATLKDLSMAKPLQDQLRMQVYARSVRYSDCKSCAERLERKLGEVGRLSEDSTFGKRGVRF